MKAAGSIELVVILPRHHDCREEEVVVAGVGCEEAGGPLGDGQVAASF